MEFKDILREKREKLGLSQKELETKLELNRANISKYEKGESKPTIDTLMKMADLFGCSVDELLGLNTVTISTPNDTIKIGSKEIELSELEALTIKDINKLLEYIKNMGIDIKR